MIESLQIAKRILKNPVCPKCDCEMEKGKCPEHGVIAPLPQAVSTGAAKAAQVGE